MNKKAFTLVEMIATITIIGILLLITIPVTNRIIANNEEDKYTAYVEIVEKAFLTYTDMECANSPDEQSIFLAELVNLGYLEQFIGVQNFRIYFYKKNDEVTINAPLDAEDKLILTFTKGGNSRTCTKTSCS